MLDVAYRYVDSPLGRLLVAATADGVVRVAFELEDHDAVLDHLATSVSRRILRSGRRTDEPAQQLDEYFAGTRTAFDLPVDLRLVAGLPAVRDPHAVRHPVRHDGELRRGGEGGGQAGGGAGGGQRLRPQPVPVVVPCHRVVRSDGTIGQYLGGPQAKAALLALEGRRERDQHRRRRGGRRRRARLAGDRCRARRPRHGRDGPLLDAASCAELAALYDDDERFRSTVDMARHRFGSGEYRYFRYPLPPLVADLRAAFWPHLLPIAREWSARRGDPSPWPDDLDGWLRQCHAAGQERPTPLMLRYGPGDWNALHRDLYGDLVFPLQVVIGLDRPGIDYTGGELVTVEQRPRAQSRARAATIPQGSAVVVTTRDRPVRTSTLLVERADPPRRQRGTQRPAADPGPDLPRRQLTRRGSVPTHTAADRGPAPATRNPGARRTGRRYRVHPGCARGRRGAGRRNGEARVRQIDFPPCSPLRPGCGRGRPYGGRIMTDAIVASGLVKHYGDVVALDGLDLAVPEGTILGLLGPNGAGKTTAVSILTTLLEPDEGTATVAGADVRAEPAAVRRKIGLSGQYAAVDEVLTGFENLDMIGRLYRLGRRRSQARATELLERFELDRRRQTARSRPTPVACAAASTSPAPWSPSRPSCSSTSRPPGSTPAAGSSSGASSASWWAAAPRCCSRPSTSRRPTSSPTTSSSSTMAARIAHGTSDELKTQVGGERIEVTVRSPADVPEAREALAGCRRRRDRGQRVDPAACSRRSPAARRCSPRPCASSTAAAWPSATSVCGAPRSTTCSSRSPGTAPTTTAAAPTTVRDGAVRCRRRPARPRPSTTTRREEVRS